MKGVTHSIGSLSLVHLREEIAALLTTVGPAGPITFSCVFVVVVGVLSTLVYSPVPCLAG